MSTPHEPLPAQAVLSVLGPNADPLWPDLLARLTARLGQAQYLSEPMAFDRTGYYAKEMGEGLARRLVGFVPLVGQSELVEIKLFTNALEKRYARPDGTRTFNLDPGLLTQERLVLATGKNFTHRIYLGRGIFADLTLIFQRGDWRSLPWTFPDYSGQEMQNHLTRMRDLYREKLHAQSARRES
ncbi:hypothetical protein JCM15519_29090 [Fundidesulfovibrio butyratiphilus]